MKRALALLLAMLAALSLLVSCDSKKAEKTASDTETAFDAEEIYGFYCRMNGC